MDLEGRIECSNGNINRFRKRQRGQGDLIKIDPANDRTLSQDDEFFSLQTHCNTLTCSF